MRRSLGSPWSMWFPCDRSNMPLWGRHLWKKLSLTLSGTQTMPHGAHTWECTAGPAQFDHTTTRPAMETQHQPLQITQCTVWRSQIQAISYLRTVKVITINICVMKCRKIVDLRVSGSSLHLLCCPDSWVVGATGPLIPLWTRITPSHSSNVLRSLRRHAGLGFTLHSDKLV